MRARAIKSALRYVKQHCKNGKPYLHIKLVFDLVYSALFPEVFHLLYRKSFEKVDRRIWANESKI
jgi:hypothetical protein